MSNAKIVTIVVRFGDIYACVWTIRLGIIIEYKKTLDVVFTPFDAEALCRLFQVSF